MASSPPVTYNALLSQLSDYLTVSFHTILHARRCYPLNSFLLARAYNFPVAQSRHPKVCEWIQSAVAAVISEVRKGAVARVALVIAHSTSQKPLERFCWDLSRLAVISKSDSDAPIVRQGDKRFSEGKEDVDLSEQLRATLSALSTCGTRLRPVPEGCTFSVAIELKDDTTSATPIGHPQPWVPAQPNLQRTRNSHAPNQRRQSREEGSAASSGIGKDVGGIRTLPMRAVEAGEFIFDLWVEEGRAKQQLQSSQDETSVDSA